MNDLSERLKRSAMALDELDRKRSENAMTPQDYEAENGILMAELRELEEDMVGDSVRRRRSERIDPR